jgi:hypothetical protein
MPCNLASPAIVGGGVISRGEGELSCMASPLRTGPIGPSSNFSTPSLPGTHTRAPPHTFPVDNLWISPQRR